MRDYIGLSNAIFVLVSLLCNLPGRVVVFASHPVSCRMTS